MAEITNHEWDQHSWSEFWAVDGNEVGKWFGHMHKGCLPHNRGGLHDGSGGSSSITLSTGLISVDTCEGRGVLYEYFRADSMK
jgi:hypothetical protein